MADIMPARRFPCGKKRPQKTTAEKLTELAREVADAEMALVLSQPHRRGLGAKASSPLASCAIGRFILAHSLRSEFYEAAEHWAGVKRRWLSAMGDKSIRVEAGGGGDTPMELVHAWRDECVQGERMMQEYGGSDGVVSVTWMAFHDYEFAPGASVPCAIRALAGLAYAMGKIDKKVLDGIVG